MFGMFGRPGATTKRGPHKRSGYFCMPEKWAIPEWTESDTRTVMTKKGRRFFSEKNRVCRHSWRAPHFFLNRALLRVLNPALFKCGFNSANKAVQGGRTIYTCRIGLKVKVHRFDAAGPHCEHLVISGVTRVGDTRGGNWGCHPSIFIQKPGDLFSRQFCSVITPFILSRVSPPGPGPGPWTVSPCTFFICLTSFLHYSL